LGLYGVFLAIQTSRHRDYFLPPKTPDGPDSAAADEHAGHEVHSVAYHLPLLIVYLVLVMTLAKKLAVPIDHGIHVFHLPAALGGFLVSVLILSPESMASVRSALANQLQRCVNLLLGSVLASISLTVPAALTVGFLLDQTIVLGLDAVDMVLLLLTLAV